MRTQALGAGLLAQHQSAAAPFRLHRPTGVTETCALVAEHPDATVAAGCSDLIARMREGEQVQRLISLRQVAELGEISRQGALLRIGATVTHHRGSCHPLVEATLPGFAAAWNSIATVRIRYTGTLGGNLRAGRHRYEMPLMLGALEAGHDTDQTGRLLLGVHIDTSTLVWFGYERSLRPITTLAMAIRRADTGELVICAVSGSEYRRGFTLRTETGVDDLADLDIASVSGRLAAQLPDDCADYNGSAEYRRHLAQVLASRLLRRAGEEKQR
ncbi:FAD binding domain-containing protein [Gordonia sp. CPCC 206044]|uniref:FAD binding domain-containing protein n=1 Tax=Gordonia sp. CPCC 206044 TaxID=3140793 RepID=UPI003AF36002